MSIRILFIYETPFDWINYQELFLALQNNQQFEVDIWAIPHIDLTSSKKTQAQTDILDSAQVNYKIANTENEDLSQFDYVIYSSPFDVARPECFKTTQAHNHSRLLYIPYNADLRGDEYRKKKFNSFLDTNAFGIFVRSDQLKADYAKYCSTGDNHVYATGLPRLDNSKVFTTEHSLNLQKQIDHRPCLLWNTRYSIDENEYASLDMTLQPMLAFAEKTPDVAVLWRPHPALFYTLEQKLQLFNQREIKQLKEEINALGIIVDEDINYMPAFELSDAMVSDVGTFLIDYLVTLKPVLVTKPAHHPKLDDEGEFLLDAYLTTQSETEFIKLLPRLLNDYTLGAEQRRNAKNKLLPYQDGKASLRIIQSILHIHEEFGL